MAARPPHPTAPERRQRGAAVPETRPPLRAVHTFVPGRARVKVAALYRCQQVKTRIESALGGVPGIRGVDANVLTGSVLVQFTPDTTIDDVLAAIEAQLRATECRAHPPTPAPRHAGPASLPANVASLVGQRRKRAQRAGAHPPADFDAHARPWHALGAAETLATLNSAEPYGLSQRDAAARLARHGPNALAAVERRSRLAMVLEQFLNWPVGLLAVSAVIAVFTGGAVDAAVIMGVVAINAAIGYVTEQQAERIIGTLGGAAPRSARLVREGSAQNIPVNDIVSGDVLLLAPGSHVAADARLLQGHRLSLDESALTGESMPVTKDADFLAPPDTPLGDRANMVYRGTTVTGGSGLAAVVATGDRTELGQIQALVGNTRPPETPMQKQLGRLGTQLALLSGAVCAGVFGLGLVRGYGWLDMLKASVSLAVAAVPEGLPAVATTTLAMGIRDMRSRRVAVRHLDAVETLGAVQVFCLDKTGTLTLNRMRVVSIHTGTRHIAVTEGRFTAAGRVIQPRECQVCRRARETKRDIPVDPFVLRSATALFSPRYAPVIRATAPKAGLRTASQMALRRLGCALHVAYVPPATRPRPTPTAGSSPSVASSDELLALLQIVALCSETELAGQTDSQTLNGSATENALVEAALEAGVDVRALRERHPQLTVRYRAEGRPYMTTVHRLSPGRQLVAVKGSPEDVLARCRRRLCDGTLCDLGEEQRAAVAAANEALAGDALRILGVAYAEVDGDGAATEDDLIWLGLVGMADPLRAGMAELMAAFHRAGVRTVMITGDQGNTAYAVGKQLNLADGATLEILDSTRLDKLDPALLAGLVKKVHVFARVSPAHKLRIVQALQQAGNVVAMTGDGINDGPALKAADIGVAMGKSGTDVARSVADVVLLDDNLDTMVVAVRQGRTIYGNIRKTVHFLLATNFTEIEVMLAGIALGLGQPLNPMQLLWINLISDIFPGLALSLEPPEPDVLAHPPRDPDEPIVRRGDLKRMGVESAVISAGAMTSYGYALLRYGAGPRAGTHAFLTLTTAQLLHAISCRSHQTGIFSAAGRPPNRYLNLALAGSFAAQALAVLIPPVRTLLGIAPIGLVDGAVIGAGATLPFLINELTKPGVARPACAPPSPQGANEEGMHGERIP